MSRHGGRQREGERVREREREREGGRGRKLRELMHACMHTYIRIPLVLEYQLSVEQLLNPCTGVHRYCTMTTDENT